MAKLDDVKKAVEAAKAEAKKAAENAKKLAAEAKNLEKAAKEKAKKAAEIEKAEKAEAEKKETAELVSTLLGVLNNGNFDSKMAVKKAVLAHLTGIRGGGTGGGGKKNENGVIGTIASLITEAGEAGISKDEIVEALAAKFPEKDPESMRSTVNIQVPSRLRDTRDMVVERMENGKYRVKA